MNYYCFACNKCIEKPGLCAECEQYEIDSRQFAVCSAVDVLMCQINGEPHQVETYLRECFNTVDRTKYGVEVIWHYTEDDEPKESMI